MSRRSRIEQILKRPPRMRFSDVEAILLDFDYRLRRTSGSHCIFSKAGELPLSIPKDKGRWVNEPYLDQVCKRLGLDNIDLDDF